MVKPNVWFSEETQSILSLLQDTVFLSIENFYFYT